MGGRPTYEELEARVRELEQEHRNMQKSCLEREERYQALFHRSFDIIYIHDLEGRFLDGSDMAVKVLGYPREELLLLTLQDLLTEDQMPTVRERLKELRETGTLKESSEYLVRCKDGSRIWLETKASVIYRDGKPYAVQGIARDITGKKEVVERLRRREERYRNILESMEEAYYEVDLKGNFTFFNATPAQRLGYASDELMGVNFRQYMDEQNAGKVFDAYHQVFLTGQPVTLDWELTDRKGQKYSVEASVSLKRDEDGNPSGFKGVVRDISQRKIVEKALHQSNERYRTIFENTGNSTILIAEDTTILLANSNFEKLTGYSKEEMEGRMSWTVFVAPEDLQRMKQYHAQRRKDPSMVPGAYEFRMKRRDGELRDIFLTIALIPGSKESVASCMDITERKRAEESLRISEERLRDLAELLPETVYETDVEGRFTFVNRFAYDRFKYTVEDFARGLYIMDVIAPEDHARAKENIKDILDGRKIGLSEYTARRKDGTTFSAMVHSTAIIHDGEPVGMRCFLIDISEKKSLEEQLARAQKMEAIGTLAGGIAHDFNNLLMGILGNVSLLVMKADESHPFLDRLKNIEEYVQRGSDLTRQLLGFARGGKYEVRPTDLGEFVRRSSEMFGRTKKEVRIHRKIGEGLWTVELDRGQMEQVLLNLYVNAWQAMPSGGDLYLSVENAVLDETDVGPYDLKPGRYVKITVTDTGSGMDEAVKARVFEPFFTTKELGRGTGLGLASVYGIVKNHSGFVHLESEKGVGSTFMIFLPASNKMPDRERKTADELQRGKGTILLIDDEDMILDVGSQMLAGLGYTVFTARGGRNGIDIYAEKTHEIDLVILDLIMPDMGGNVTFDRLREINPFVKVLLSSGYSLDGQAKDIMEKGCKGFIQKPFTLETLSQRVSGILDQR
jgi:PAS domain S-box-containing protein